MHIIRALLRSTATLGGGINKKTNELIPFRHVLQVEDTDNRGLVVVTTITVPDLVPFESKVGQVIDLPVRPWATGQSVNFSYEPTKTTA